MKKILAISLSTALLLSIMIGAVGAQGSTIWTAEYYGNVTLTGAPLLIRSEGSPSNNWGFGSPAANIPADHFSARWTSVQSLNAGIYRLRVRADDGVRVFIDGVLRIDEWHPSPSNVYTTDVQLTSGTHSFLVQYFEATGAALLDYQLTRIGNEGVSSTGATATVTASLLNVRDAPNPFTGRVLTRIRGRETYPVIGRNADASWAQLDVNGLIGWANTSFLSTVNLQNVPVTDGSVQPTGATATVTAFLLNVRDMPNVLTGRVLTQIRQGETYDVTGRNLDGSWVRLNVNGIIGWSSAAFLNIVNLQNVPVIDGSTGQPAPMVNATVTAFFLNVRNAPNPFTGTILTVIERGQTFPVVGRNTDSSWVQINVNGLTGWVNRSWVSVSGDVQSLPIRG